MYPATLFDGRQLSAESPTTAIVRHSFSMRTIVSGELRDIAREPHRVKLLQRMNVGSVLRFARSDRFDECLRASHRRHARHVVLQRRASNRLFIVVRSTTKGCIDYEGDRDSTRGVAIQRAVRDDD